MIPSPMTLPVTPLALIDLLDKARPNAPRGGWESNATTISQGGRNTTLTKVGGSYRRQGLTEPEIAAALIEFNAKWCDPPLPEAEVRGIARSVSRYPAGRRHELTDLGNARRLVERFGEDIRYCQAWKSWLVWDGTRWRKDETGAVVRMAKEMAEAMLLEAQALRKEFQDAEE